MSEPTARGTMGIVIVDDEPPARDLLRQYLADRPDVSILRECANGFEAVKAVEELAPDLLLLDIQMPKLNGFEVLELLDSPPQVVFTTAYDEFALRAFEVEAIDYLLKPFSAERLSQALDRAVERLRSGQAQPLERLTEHHRDRARPLQRLLVRAGAQIHVVAAESIDYIEAQDDYVAIATGGRKLRKKQTLGQLESLLGERFVRIHRSYLLNLDRLSRIEPYAKDSRVAFLEDGTRLPVSRAGYERLRGLL